MKLRLIFCGIVGPLFWVTCSSKVRTATPEMGTMRPLVIGHRGASGYLPEHTLESYVLAIEMGADFIEPDLVSTKDGVLVARHEPFIGKSTDVSVKFPKRKTKKQVDLDNKLQSIEDWFIEDFTWAEVQQLRARQSFATRDQSHNDKYRIPRFEEIVELALKKTKEKGRTIGLYPETKHPSYFRKAGLPLEERLVAILAKYNLNTKDSPVFIQSFEISNLRDILAKLTPVKLIQLLDEPDWQPYDYQAKGELLTYEDMLQKEGLRSIAKYAYGIGPWTYLIVREDKNTKKLLPPRTIIADAHAVGLKVHPYTFRSDRLHPDYRGDALQEYKVFFQLGADAVFSDFPDTAVKARAEFLGK